MTGKIKIKRLPQDSCKNFGCYDNGYAAEGADVPALPGKWKMRVV